MHIHDTTTTVVVGGLGDLERHEELLLDQMTAPLGPCQDCGTDGLFLTMWTPLRTVRRIVCGCCLRSLWESPGSVS